MSNDEVERLTKLEGAVEKRFSNSLIMLSSALRTCGRKFITWSRRAGIMSFLYCWKDDFKIFNPYKNHIYRIYGLIQICLQSQLEIRVLEFSAFFSFAHMRKKIHNVE
ncbi:hypothetical protein H5410_057405 [Solanum commersonii]|uniref:Uncharacterized protein n=1 Tax=Solanum commersonii TaxID=4109 RepID=A0A9J5WPZ1_SOLCO|nr:hypothetical protein H5410_057405 [Solanum commersonii]